MIEIVIPVLISVIIAYVVANNERKRAEKRRRWKARCRYDARSTCTAGAYTYNVIYLITARYRHITTKTTSQEGEI